MSVRIVAVVLAGLLVGCTVRYRTVTTGRELHRNLVALRTQGVADVEVYRYRSNQESPDVRTERVRFDQRVLVGGKPRLISELATHCKDAVPFAEDKISQHDCELVKLRESPIELGRFETRSARAALGTAVGWVLAVFILGGGAFAITCEFACTEGSDVETAADYTAGALGVFFAALIVWFLIDCMGKWGSPGCRD